MKFSCIDLSFISANLAIKTNWSVNNDPWGSDHFPITIEINVTPTRLTRKNFKYNLNKLDWDAFHDTLTSNAHLFSSMEFLNYSRSNLEALNKIHGLQNKPPLVKKIKLKLIELADKDVKVEIFWLLAHIGLQGNENADTNAKKAAAKDISFNLDIPVSDIFAKFKYLSRPAELSKSDDEDDGDNGRSSCYSNPHQSSPSLPDQLELSKPDNEDDGDNGRSSRDPDPDQFSPSRRDPLMLSEIEDSGDIGRGGSLRDPDSNQFSPSRRDSPMVSEVEDYDDEGSEKSSGSDSDKSSEESDDDSDEENETSSDSEPD
ncbi:hypothetical protein TKK_0009969 [Trichogramma kaykai]